MSKLHESFGAGYGCLSAWADLLDRINVFPVADGDTGTNLRISLAPLRSIREDDATVANQLAQCATGNSGNIAAGFFQEFCQARNFGDLPRRAAVGSEKARQAVATPCEGTMLTVFDRLAAVLAGQQGTDSLYPLLARELQESVRESLNLLPDLHQAGVVDSGALGMYIFFDCFFRKFLDVSDTPTPLLDNFAGLLAVDESFSPTFTNEHCVDFALEIHDEQSEARNRLVDLGESVVVLKEGKTLKVHVHTPDPEQLRQQLDGFGEIVRWSEDKIDQSSVNKHSSAADNSSLHIITDAAGSLTKQMADRHNITLLDSYIIAGNSAKPESLCVPEQVYSLMRQGAKLSTAQASTFERHQHYQSACQQFGHCLYLCVGSAFTGNYDIAMAWKEKNELGEYLSVIDSGAASGRLALMALLTARFAQTCPNRQEVVDFAKEVMGECIEYVFIDELKYLVAGGRLSRTSGFFGDLLHMKPIISPGADGVKKEGVVRSKKGQVAFALEKLTDRFAQNDTPILMLQYSDNKSWLMEIVQPQVETLLPRAELLLTPLSLTSGVHMGPGTWSLAFASNKTNGSAKTDNLQKSTAHH